MTFDLPAMIARERGRRGTVTMRPIEVPQALERELYRIAREVVVFWAGRLREDLLPLYAREVETLRAMTRDQGPDGLEAEIAAIAEGARRLVVTLNQRLASWVVRVETWHRGRWVNGVRASTGFSVESLVANLSANDEVQAFQRWASGLIRDLSDELRQRVEAEVFQGFASQTPRRTIGRELSKALEIARKRANLIARDQANKLSGKLDELRHREAGVERYRWETARDDRVRRTHRANQGKVFRWDKPPRVTGHPRTEINCRCTAQPYIDLVEEVDPSLDFEGRPIAA